MTLIRFKQIRSAFQPEYGTSFCVYKWHQVCYFIRMFNDKSKIIFVPGEHGTFYEGIIYVRIRYCLVRMYNKDKPDKYRVDFFILANAKYYFIFHIDVCQGKNTENIDTHPLLHKLPTT